MSEHAKRWCAAMFTGQRPDFGLYDGVFIGDKTHGGLEAPDSNAIQWAFLPNYSDDLTIVTPDFNPLTDLKPANVGG